MESSEIQLMILDLEAIKTGYFINEKNQYGSRRYVTNAQIRVGRAHKNRIRWAIILVTVILAAVISLLIFWNSNSRTKGLETNSEQIPNEFSSSIVVAKPEMIPEYSGTDFIELNNNVPCFTSFDYEHISGETFSELDLLGRCGAAVAMIDRNMMPKEKRGEIGNVKPSGWKQEKYPGIIDSQPPYLYNRCHLIAYALTGQNANEKNLITGTRYLNVGLMLPYEIRVAQYLDHSENHVLYRVSPLFMGGELVARGIEMEAYSVKDAGEGICFHVFLYNVQPNVSIDYMTGESELIQSSAKEMLL